MLGSMLGVCIPIKELIDGHIARSTCPTLDRSSPFPVRFPIIRPSHSSPTIGARAVACVIPPARGRRRPDTRATCRRCRPGPTTVRGAPISPATSIASHPRPLVCSAMLLHAYCSSRQRTVLLKERCLWLSDNATS
jgi:hypothetical protein